MKSLRRGLEMIRIKFKMANKNIDIKWVLLVLIILVLFLAFNYISFLENENQSILASLNNSVTHLQTRINMLEKERKEAIAAEPTSGNRGFLTKKSKLTTSRD